MSRGEFADFLDASLAVLRRETPPAVRHLAEQLAGRAVCFEVEPAPFALRVTADGHHLDPRVEDCPVSLGLARSVVLDLIAGKLTLPEAVMRERLRPRGRAADLGCFFDALTAYLEGAVRAPSFPRLYRAYRRSEPIPSDLED